MLPGRVSGCGPACARAGLRRLSGGADAGPAAPQAPQAPQAPRLFAQDRALILDAMNQAVSRLYAYENEEPNEEPGEGEGNDAVA